MDGTMCTGESCPRKEFCYRHTARANEYRQSYFCKVPVEEDGSCTHYSCNGKAASDVGKTTAQIIVK